MKKVTIEVFSFEELSNEAKEKARQWYREDLSQELSEVEVNAKYDLTHKFGIEAEDVFWLDPYSQGYSAYINTGTFVDDWEVIEKAMKHSGLDNKLEVLNNNFDNFDIATLQINNSGLMGYRTSHVEQLGFSNYAEDEGLFEQLEDIFLDLTDIINKWFNDEVNTWLYNNVREMVEEVTSDEYIDERMQENDWDFKKDGTYFYD